VGHAQETLMQRARLNIALAVVFAGLGAAIFFSQKKEEKKPPLTSLTADSISQVTLEHPDAPAIKLEKQNGTWMLTEPIQSEVDKFEVNGILSLATQEQRSTVDPAQTKLSDLELDPPNYTATLNDVKLLMGGMEPLQYQRYIKIGDKIVLTDDPPSAALDKDYSDLVSKSLLPEGVEIQKIEAPGLTLSRDTEKWVLTPADPKASADQLQKLADGWKNARALWNELDVNAKTAKGDIVTVTLKDRTLRFVVVSRDPQLQLVRPELGVRFNLGKDQVEQLLKLPAPPPQEAPKPVDDAAAAGEQSK
jgi:hypothetical protein